MKHRTADAMRSMDMDAEIAEREQGIENLKASIEKVKVEHQKAQEEISAHNQRIVDEKNRLRTEIAQKLGYSEADLSNERKRKNLDKKHQAEVAKNPDGEIARLTKGTTPTTTHSYEVNKIELQDGQTTEPNALLSRKSYNSIGAGKLHETVSVAKILRGVEKSYDKGKNILEESKKADELSEIAFRDGDDMDIAEIE